VHYVVDGGFLLHLLNWPCGSTYGQLAQGCADFVIRKFGHCTVVFDGYCSGPSTKDVSHLRRASKEQPSRDFAFDSDMVVCESKNKFLGNAQNKQRFINLLSSILSEHKVETVCAKGDADCLIVKTALDIAKGNNVAVVGDDTDLLVLLLFHAVPVSGHSVFFTSAKASSAKTMTKVWDVFAVKRSLGENICQLLPSAHALEGCDSTSSLFAVGKSQVLKKANNSTAFREQAAVFSSIKSSKDAIAGAGEKALLPCMVVSLQIL